MSNPAKDVLIVDDDDGIRNLVALALSRARLTCDTAVIAKPFDVPELRERVHGCVSLRQRHEARGAQPAEGVA